MSELVKLIGAMAERGWVYTTFDTFDSIAFTHTDGEIKQFKSWDEVAAFVEREMIYPVGELLTREYNDIERRILQAKLFYTNDSWYKSIRFIAKDGSFGVKQVTDDEAFDIEDIIRYIRRLPLLECLTGNIYIMAIHRFYIPLRIVDNYHAFMEKYQWLYNTETWEGEK